MSLDFFISSNYWGKFSWILFYRSKFPRENLTSHRTWIKISILGTPLGLTFNMLNISWRMIKTSGLDIYIFEYLPALLSSWVFWHIHIYCLLLDTLTLALQDEAITLCRLCPLELLTQTFHFVFLRWSRPLNILSQLYFIDCFWHIHLFCQKCYD